MMFGPAGGEGAPEDRKPQSGDENFSRAWAPPTTSYENLKNLHRISFFLLLLH